ncbi:MAG: aminopeptidase N [Burkholderiales bacterium]|jgi:aminopeptidase N|nr:aminopeptidase N [Burkholderiales bacterium]
MRDPAPTVVRLADYTPPAFLVDTVDLDVDIRDDHAVVRARIALRRNPQAAVSTGPLVLDGDELTLLSIAIDGTPLSADAYTVESDRLVVAQPPAQGVVETLTRIDPFGNTKLMGFFRSKDGLFTQCEAEGFRRITWFLDRPDVMARYTCTLHADAARFPQLLSNGNPVAAGVEPGGRHFATWVDPFPKPSYLFAMVAAKLDVLEDTIVTRSGRRAQLAVYVEPGKLDQADFAMAALKKSIRWDEERFGLELDLDRFMIVAVGDFNMGAMENKGLNIFNTKYVLARPDTATDGDYLGVDRVVAHEYFHNWTGNRVTCRDWFQLSLKEGLTVFRDQEFGADMYSRPVQRIQEVRGLRAAQFPEDAGPMAHPIRPQSYMEISNFYTATVYEKGAEVVRMIHTLIGRDAFRRGMDLYFARHDGKAVTTDDFVDAMQDAGGVDLTQFRRWYDQAGTPHLDADTRFDADTRRFTLTLTQTCGPSPGQPDKLPFHIPVAVGLLGPDGTDLPLRLDGEAAPDGTTRVLSLTEPQQTWTFVDVPARPVVSLLRDFSAPVVLHHDASEADLMLRMAHDADAFNRWEAGQQLATGLILAGVAARREHRAFDVPTRFVDAFAAVLADADRDPAFAAEALSLPSESFVAEQLDEVDPDAIHAVRVRVRQAVAERLRDALLARYRSMAVPGRYSPDAVSAGRRALRNLCLGYLMELDDAEVRAICVAQFDGADNMTDTMAALGCLAATDCDERQPALDRFHARWKHEALVLDKWFAVQASSRLPGTLARVQALLRHPDFDLRNPNRARSVIGVFCHGNPVRFHAADGAGYAFFADQVIQLDAINPQVASRLARAMDRWRRYDTGRQAHARAALERIRDRDGLSKDVTEVVTRALA